LGLDVILMYMQKSNTVLSLMGVVVILASLIVTIITITPVQAQRGQGEDIFRVIMTIFGVDESKGDVIAIVTVRDEEAKVKLFDASGPEVVPLNASEGGSHLIEYVATFPNVTVNSGDEYRACVATVKDLELICKSGNNSPAARPEFVDLSLNATSGDVEQVAITEEEVTVEEGDSDGEEDVADETDGGEEENNVSPG
jgi:hypothetical protein